MISDITERVNTIDDALDKLSAKAKKSGTFFLPAGNAKAIDDLSGEARYDLECIKERYFELADLVIEAEHNSAKRKTENLRLKIEIKKLERKLGIIEQDKGLRIGKIISKQS